MKKKGIPISIALIVFSLLMGLSGYGQDRQGEIYVIKRGDTLWDLSGEYLNDPWEWPGLWERNQYITNPHLIYPGNSLRLHGRPVPMRPKTAKEAERVGGAATEAQPVSETATARDIQEVIEESAVTEARAELPPSQEEEKAELALRTEREDFAQILRKGSVEYLILEEESLGTIVDSRYEKKLLAQGDSVYLALKERPAVIGERFLIFRTKKMLRNPYTGKRGKKVYVVGALEVTAIKGVLYQAEITASMDAVLRGDEVMTYRAIE